MNIFVYRIRFYIPTIVTLLSLFLAFSAIILVPLGDFYCSFGFALLAFITDTLDGFLARKFGVETKIGAVLDSFGDVFIYLLYPAVVFIYFFELNSPLAFCFIALFFFAGLYRLVRFTKIGFSLKDGKIGYAGVPVVFSHVLVLCFVLLKVLDLPFFVLIAYTGIFALTVLMVQNFYFPKPKRIYGIIIFLFTLTVFFFSLCSI